MRIKPTTLAVVGQGSATRWGQVLQGPQAYGVVEIEAAEGVARRRGIELLTKVSRLLSDPPSSLKELKSIADSVWEEGVVTLALLVPAGKVLYIVLCGKGKIYLKRGSRLAVLLAGEGEICGQTEKGDAILLASASFVSAVTEEELVAAVSGPEVAEGAEKLTVSLHNNPGGEGGAGLIFQIDNLVTSEEEVQPKSRPRQNFRPNRLAIIVAIVFILFITSIGLGIRRQVAERQNKEVTKALELAGYAFEEGMALLDLNPIKSRERFSQAKEALEPFISNGQVKILYEQVVDNLTRAMQVVEGEPILFFDLSLVKAGAVAGDISLFGDTLGVIDPSGKTLYQLWLASKKSQIVAGGEVYTDVSQVAAWAGTLYTLVPAGIRTNQLIITRADEWGVIKDLVAYAGNLYLLDTQKSRIWKYVAGESGFSELREYFNPDTLPDLSQATSLAIDGMVWVGAGQGRILRFSQGKEQTFIPQGVSPALKNKLVVYASDQTENVYVLEPEGRRVVALDKEGNYLSQYVWKSSLQPEELVVSEDQKKILLLAEGKIYALELK